MVTIPALANGMATSVQPMRSLAYSTTWLVAGGYEKLLRSPSKTRALQEGPTVGKVRIGRRVGVGHYSLEIVLQKQR